MQKKKELLWIKKDLKKGIRNEKNMLLDLINSNTQELHLANKYLDKY